jgi:hypothetical protein
MKMQGFASASSSPLTRHSRARGNLGFSAWIPAFAGMTETLRLTSVFRVLSSLSIFEGAHEGHEGSGRKGDRRVAPTLRNAIIESFRRSRKFCADSELLRQ